MDLFTLFTSATLAVVGIFLSRDYARFLRGSYTLFGNVTSIQPVSTNTFSGSNTSSYVKSGFYPVIKYETQDGPVTFTSIDEQTSGRFHIGDEISLRVRNTRRRENRVCRMAAALLLMNVLLITTLIIDAISSDFRLAVERIFLISVVLAVCLASLVAYLRDCDELRRQELRNTSAGKVLMYLYEPTAYRKWNTAMSDPSQLYKIRSKQLIGVTCVFSAMFMLAAGV